MFVVIADCSLCSCMLVTTFNDETAANGVITSSINQDVFIPRLEFQSICVELLNDFRRKTDIMFRIKLDWKATAQHELQGLLHFLELLTCPIKIYRFRFISHQTKLASRISAVPFPCCGQTSHELNGDALDPPKKPFVRKSSKESLCCPHGPDRMRRRRPYSNTENIKYTQFHSLNMRRSDSTLG